MKFWVCKKGIRPSTKLKSWFGFRCTDSPSRITQEKTEYSGTDAKELVVFVLGEDDQNFDFWFLQFSQWNKQCHWLKEYTKEVIWNTEEIIKGGRAGEWRYLSNTVVLQGGTVFVPKFAVMNLNLSACSHVFHQPYSLVLMQVNMSSPMAEIHVFC